MDDLLVPDLNTIVFKKYWLPLEPAVQRVVRFEREYGKVHLDLACHAALPSILTPEWVKLIRLRFLEECVGEIADSDLLHSALCDPIGQNIFEIEPRIRQVLLVALQADPGYGRLEEVAKTLRNFNETPQAASLSISIKRTYQLISGAYIDPDATIQNMFDLLRGIGAGEFVSRMPDYLHIGKTLAMIAGPLEATSLQVELEDLVSATHLATLYWRGDQEKGTLCNILNSNIEDLDDVIYPLTWCVAQWLLASDLFAPTAGVKNVAKKE